MSTCLLLVRHHRKKTRTGMAQSDRRVASGFLKCLHPSPAILLPFTLVPSQNGRLGHARTTEGAYLKVIFRDHLMRFSGIHYSSGTFRVLQT